jgi:3-oxoacyl-[acyl-carrier protein] reductase
MEDYMATKTAFITGASRGIGRACALALAGTGTRVALAARDMVKLEEVATEVRALGAEAHVVAIDMASFDSIKEAIASTARDFGRIDILVNNAGITRDGLALRMMQGMMKERWGRIINISSIVGESGNPGQANYVASKAGLIGLTKSLAQEIASRNITVNAVTPGFIETDMTHVLTDDQKNNMLAHIPLKRFGKPEEIAAAVKFLASDDAGYITGHVLSVNGGMYM